MDFSEIGRRLCNWLEDNWDHRFLVWDSDPWRIPISKIDAATVWVPFNPTAENMAEYLVTQIGPAVLEGTGVNLVKCCVEETRKCSATFELHTDIAEELSKAI
jgi:6-pyruvoyltetrahydropterin/6-carboxytetrahydropterin synthase